MKYTSFSILLLAVLRCQKKKKVMYSSLRLYFEVHSRAGFESQAGVSWSSALALLQAIFPLVDMIHDYYDSRGGSAGVAAVGPA